MNHMCNSESLFRRVLHYSPGLSGSQTQDNAFKLLVIFARLFAFHPNTTLNLRIRNDFGIR